MNAWSYTYHALLPGVYVGEVEQERLALGYILQMKTFYSALISYSWRFNTEMEKCNVCVEVSVHFFKGDTVCLHMTILNVISNSFLTFSGWR